MTERRSISQEKLETMKAMDAIKFTDKNMNLIKICGTKELPFLSPVIAVDVRLHERKMNLKSV